MIKVKQRFIYLYFVYILLNIVPVLGGTLPFKSYSFKEGLAASAVNCIYQDADGYMWFGTYYGISRFDGLQFQSFGLVDGMAGDRVWDIFEDKNKTLWIATNKGVISRSKSGRFRDVFQVGPALDKRVSAAAIAVDKNKRLLFGTSSGVWSCDGKQLIPYLEQYNLKGKGIRDIAVSETGTIWLGTDTGLIAVDPSEHILHRYTQKNGLPADHIRTLTVSRDGAVWIGTVGGLSCYRDGTFRTYTSESGLPDLFISALLEDKNNNLWIGTRGGLSCFASGKFSNYYTSPGGPGQQINALYEDREGNIWFGTDIGINRIISLNTTVFTNADGLPGNLVWSIGEGKDGRYWFGTNSGVCSFADGKFDYYISEEKLRNCNVYSILVDGRGRVWMGTDQGVSFFYAGKFTHYTPSNGLPGRFVLSLAEDVKGTIWIGTTGGLCRFVGGKIMSPPFESSKRSVRTILEDKQGNLWFSDKAGIVRVSENRTTRFTTESGLVHNIVNSLSEDRYGGIWICTDGGLSCLSDGKFINFTTRNGLAYDYCYFALEDGNSNIWVGTVKGINRISGINKASFKVDSSMNHLVSAEIAQGSGIMDSNGNLWFGSVNGVTRFNTKSIRSEVYPPPIHMDYIKVFENDIPFSKTKSIILDHNQNFMKFGFIGLSFTSPEELKYKYRLNGYDSNWVESGNRSVHYANLPPGNYSFEVSARNSQGIESVKPSVIHFTILPPFWATWWFRVFIGLVLVTLLVTVFRWRSKRVKERTILEERNKQLIMAQKMELLGLLAGGAVHDLKNLLTTIFNYSGMATQISDGGELQKKAGEKIRTATTTAIRLSKQILSFTRKADEEIRPVNLPDLLNEIADILKIMIPRKTTIQVSKSGDPMKMRINPTHFHQIVMNLCLNAAHAMPEGGEINLRLHVEKGSIVVLTVSDAGTGMDPFIKEHIFDPLYSTKDAEKGTGLGLFVVKQIVDLYKGEIRVESSPGNGTTFTICFPKG